MISFCFVGDYCPAGSFCGGTGPSHLVCARCQLAIDNADLAIANLESCLVEDSSQCDKFMAVPESECGVIAESGFNVFTLANNHILDCGQESLLFTRDYLHRAGIRTVGGGENIEDADAPLVLVRDGKRIAIFGVTDATHYRARRNRAGISPLYRKQLKKSIRKISAEVDLVVVCIHSDLEFTNYPSPWKVKLSRQLVQAGADIVVHHHPHTLQGVETYEGSLIAYSLGNFVFPVHGREYMKDKDGNVDESVILEVEVRFPEKGEREIVYKVVPIVISEDNLTRTAEGEEADRIASKVSAISGALADQALLRRHYFGLCREQARRFLRGTYYAFRKGGILEAYTFLRVHFTTGMHRNWMRGYLSRGMH
jgi:poly-gamma-glutamate capsule biosynthesis protein CapA/YwtB (metallophosphatase superfamily)